MDELEHLLPDTLSFATPFRTLIRHAALVLLAITVSACSLTGQDGADGLLKPSDHPVTFETSAKDARMRKLAEAQHPKILETYGGEYSDPKLERMVARVVGRLIAVSQDPDQSYKITILDSPSINAFALPGGFLYVTRGLLALANDGAELAAVLSHEMAHVTANHGIQRRQAEQEAGIAEKVAQDVLAGDPKARAAVIRGKLRLAEFSRNQELEADAISIKQIGEAGFDPFAAARFLRSMSAYSQFRSVSGAKDPSLDFLASHPSSQRRIELALRHARTIGPQGTGITDRDAYLDGIDGILYGDTPTEGFVRGRSFLHPRLGIRFSVPEGFVIDNAAAAVTAAGPGDMAVRFDGIAVDSGTSPAAYIASGWVSGLDETSIRPMTIGGLPGATAQARADGWKFDIAVMRSGPQMFRMLTAAPLASNDLESTAAFVRDSFAVMSEAERNSLRPLRVRVERVKSGQTLAQLAARMSGTDRKLDLFRLLNALGPGNAISAGDRVKIVTDR
ncbi:M48 family metalloprotease [Zhengella mangrovi]|uniref:M48 family metalloprotease n=1 Tax=Zhengella mangrovi TaxID=1982044 RepID=UPI003CCA060E